MNRPPRTPRRAFAATSGPILAATCLLLAILAGPARGQAVVYGSGCAGAGSTPLIWHTGSSTVGEHSVLHLSGAPPGAIVILLIGLSDTQGFGQPLPWDVSGLSGIGMGCSVLCSGDIMLAINANGAGEIAFAFTNPHALGMDLYFQWIVVDNASPLQLAFSAGLHLHLDKTLTAEPAAIDLGSVTVGSTSAAFPLTVRNDTDTTLALDDALLYDAQANDFDVQFEAPQPVTLPPGASTQLDVTFSPQGTGARHATLQLVQASLPPGFPAATVALSGVGLGPPGAEVLLNAGGSEYYDAQMQPWSADFGATGGSSASTASSVAGTADQPLYQSFRIGPAFSYSIAVPDGTWEVTAHIAEPDATGPGQRLFDILAEGQPLATGLDPWATWGPLTAGTVGAQVEVTDGRIDIDFEAATGDAIACAIEARRLAPSLAITPASLDFGYIPIGQSSTQGLSLANTGNATATVDSVSFLIGAGGGAGSEFQVDFGGQVLTGATTDTTVPLGLALRAGARLGAEVSFVPGDHMGNDVVLRFNGNFDPIDIPLAGFGGEPGDPFLHVVIETDPIVVDHDGNGVEDVVLDGSQSHTHEPGHVLTAFTWTEGVAVIGSAPTVTTTLPVGLHHILLQIADDNVPAQTLTGPVDVQVVPATAVPGVLVLHHDVADPVAALDAVPSNVDFGEVVDGFFLDGTTAIGGSTLQGSDLVVMKGKLSLAAPDTATFELHGGAGTRLFVDGAPYAAPVALGAGSHALEARFAVLDASEQPLEVLAGLGASPPAAIDTALLVHDESTVKPVLNAMTSQGTTLGGNEVVIEGFGFFPQASVSVHWGSTNLGPANFLEQSDSLLRFLSPPHAAGTISVTVQTSQGTSNALSFDYLSDGAPPIAFTEKLPTYPISKPTCAEWGPDGRLYVATINGRLWALTFDDAWNVVAAQNYVGLSPLDNDDILGIAFNPYDPPSPVRVYVSHSLVYAWGGSTFSGPAPFIGRISVLQGPDFDTPVTLIDGLPTSNHDHAINGLAFDNNGDLLFAVGGNTNAGVQWPSMGDLPESPLTGAVLKAYTSKPGFDGHVVHVDHVSGLPVDDQVAGATLDLAPGTMVEVQAPGLRNAYDIAYTTRKRLYAMDNGPNSGFGPASTSATTQASDPSTGDELLLVERGNYYGHPNRNRGRTDARQNIYRNVTIPSIPAEFTQNLLVTGSGTGGIAEYRSDTFAGQMRGNLLVQRWNSSQRRVVLSADGRSVVSTTTMSPNISSLDILPGPGGAILGIDYTSDEVHVLVPNDASVSALTVYDITPWRAPAGGGTPFVLGGKNFGTLANTSVTIGGLPATVTSVSATRIRGTTPANPNPATALADVVVTSGAASDTLSGAFRFLPTGPGLEPGTWENGPALPVPMSEVACGIIDGVLYVIGGGTFKTYALDIAAGTWTFEPNRPFPGDHHALEVIGKKLYVVGGSLNGSEGQLQVYDTVTNTWSVGAPLPWAGGSVQTCVIGGRIYAAGGFTAGGTVDNCAVYDPALNTWTAKASMPFHQGRNHAAAGTDGTRFYIFGGRGFGSGDTNVVANGFDTVQIYDPGTNAWTTSLDPGSTLAPLPQKRGGMGKAVWWDGEFYVMGGETQSGAGANALKTYDRVDVYRPATNTWRLEASMPTARHGICPVLYQGRMFVPGGGPQAGLSQSAFLEIFSRQ